MNQHTRPDTTPTMQPIPFIDVAGQRRKLGKAIDDAVAKVLNHCQFILGPEVRTFEAEASFNIDGDAGPYRRCGAPGGEGVAFCFSVH